MDKDVALRKYELVIILDARLSDDDKENVVKGVAESIGKADGKVVNSQVWIEKQKLAFRIKKCKEGTYYLINFEGPTSGLVKIRRDLKLNEKILRVSIIQVVSHKTLEAAKG